MDFSKDPHLLSAPTMWPSDGTDILFFFWNLLGHTAHIKGAPNYILDECSSYMAADGTVLPLDDEAKKVRVCACVCVSVCVCV